MPKINRNGIKINYETYGNGPALFLTHGFSATSKMWDDQIDYLSKYFTLIVWDMRGHAKSESPVDPKLYSKMKQVNDLKAVCDTCGVSRAIFVGHSMGGYDMMLFYLKYPSYVSAWVLYATGPGFSKEKGLNSWNSSAAKLANKYKEILQTYKTVAL